MQRKRPVVLKSKPGARTKIPTVWHIYADQRFSIGPWRHPQVPAGTRTFVLADWPHHKPGEFVLEVYELDEGVDRFAKQGLADQPWVTYEKSADRKEEQLSKNRGGGTPLAEIRGKIDERGALVLEPTLKPLCAAGAEIAGRIHLALHDRGGKLFGLYRDIPVPRSAVLGESRWEIGLRIQDWDWGSPASAFWPWEEQPDSFLPATLRTKWTDGSGKNREESIDGAFVLCTTVNPLENPAPGNKHEVFLAYAAEGILYSCEAEEAGTFEAKGEWPFAVTGVRDPSPEEIQDGSGQDGSSRKWAYRTPLRLLDPSKTWWVATAPGWPALWQDRAWNGPRRWNARLVPWFRLGYFAKLTPLKGEAGRVSGLQGTLKPGFPHYLRLLRRRNQAFERKKGECAPRLSVALTLFAQAQQWVRWAHDNRSYEVRQQKENEDWLVSRQDAHALTEFELVLIAERFLGPIENKILESWKARLSPSALSDQANAISDVLFSPSLLEAQEEWQQYTGAAFEEESYCVVLAEARCCLDDSPLADSARERVRSTLAQVSRGIGLFKNISGMLLADVWPEIRMATKLKPQVDAILAMPDMHPPERKSVIQALHRSGLWKDLDKLEVKINEHIREVKAHPGKAPSPLDLKGHVRPIIGNYEIPKHVVAGANAGLSLLMMAISLPQADLKSFSGVVSTAGSVTGLLTTLKPVFEHLGASGMEKVASKAEAAAKPIKFLAFADSIRKFAAIDSGSSELRTLKTISFSINSLNFAYWVTKDVLKLPLKVLALAAPWINVLAWVDIVITLLSAFFENRYYAAFEATLLGIGSLKKEVRLPFSDEGPALDGIVAVCKERLAAQVRDSEVDNAVLPILIKYLTPEECSTLLENYVGRSWKDCLNDYIGTSGQAGLWWEVHKAILKRQK